MCISNYNPFGQVSMQISNQEQCTSRLQQHVMGSKSGGVYFTKINEWVGRYNHNPLVMILGKLLTRGCLRGM